MKTPAIRPAAALKTLTALTLLAALAALILYAYSAAMPAGASAHWTDYDTDDDGLIEIDTIAELQGIRYDHDGNGWIAPGFRGTDLAPYNAAFPNRQTSSVDTLAATTTRMGCPGACIGYELMNNLDFADATTTQRNWTPNYNYNGIFEGNGYTISNMNISLNSPAGLFPTLEANAIVRNVGLINPTVSGRNAVGALASVNSGVIIASYSSGGSITYGTASNSGTVGGLVGTNQGSIIASYSTATATKAGSITSSGVYRGGGLVGRNNNTGIITASYAAGSVSHSATGGTLRVGGLVGEVVGASSTITHSYCNTTVQATTTPCIGAWTGGAATTTAADGKTTAELQTPTGYTGIYANWNVDFNDDTFPDNPWYFGTTTSSPAITDPKTTDPPDPPAANQRTIDHDPDNDNLINVDTLQKLNAIRHDLNGDGNPANIAAYAAAFPGGHLADTSTPYMGCAATCEGYELTANLDFAADEMAVTSTDAYPNWTPIGGSYAAEFNGNGHTITRLTVNRTGTGGLFNTLANRGVIRDVRMIDPSVTASGLYAGALVAFIDTGGEISASYVQGGSIVGTGLSFLGGVAGNNNGTIRASYSSASVDAGGVAGSGAGGLIGSMANGTIIASYARGPVSGTGTGASISGFVASVSGAGSVITDSYCDTGAAGQSDCIRNQTAGAAVSAAGHSSTTLQTPTAYTGIYANWNVSVDGDAFPDNPWNFGSTTTYPALKTPAQRQAAPAIDYDSNNNNLIDIDSPHKLNAIRHDLNGDGLPDAIGNYPAYAGAFPDGDLATTTPNAARMGCPATCIGYELTANINFAADDVAVTSTDPYPNWTPIGGSYAATFDGKGNTINHLTITGATGNSGLFDTLASGGVIRDLGMVDASIGNNGADAYVGVLAGDNDGGMIITSYASGAVTVTGTSTYAGGLIGRNAGDLRAVYSTASVTASSTATTTAASPTVGGLIGLHTGSITASYAAGTTTGSAAAIVGGFAGAASSTAAAITNGYCDTDATTQSACIGAHAAGATATSTGYTTTQLQTPTGYTGIYQNWNIRLGADNMLDDPWSFGTTSEYPTIKALASRTRTAPPAPPTPTPGPSPTPTSTPATSTDPAPGDGGNGTSTPPSTPEPTDSGNGRTGTSTDTLPPPLPRTIPPEPERAYNPAHDHPEIYNNAEYEMAATCRTHDVDPETGNPRAATVTFDLGSYTGPVLLHLSIWRNGRYMAYETQGLASPGLEREGQRATLRVDTDPAQTRFRLDGRRNGLAANLVLGYADCRSDDS